jgi:hypothetical protein
MRIQSILYATLNPLVRAFLRSPLQGLASGSVCVLHYRGRKSARPYETPLSYVREGSLVRMLSSHETHWWKNFVDKPAVVEVEIAGRRHRGVARSITLDGEEFRDGIRRFLTALPRDAWVYGIKLDAHREPRDQDIANAAGHVVLVEVQLSS